MTETQTYGRGPHHDIIATLPINVSARQQRQANDLFYGILEQIQAEETDADVRARQLMFVFPAYEQAVRTRIEKGHPWEQVINDPPSVTIHDAFYTPQTVEKGAEAFEKCYRRPFEPNHQKIKKPEMSSSLEELLQALENAPTEVFSL